MIVLCYTIQLYFDNYNDIRFDLQVIYTRRSVVDVLEAQFFLSKFRSMALSPSRVTYQGRYIVESSTTYRISLVIQKTYPEYAQSPGHTRLHDIKVSTRKMCSELRENTLSR